MVRFRAILLVICAVLVMAGCASNPDNHSTSGVVLVDADKGIAKLPSDETLVLKHNVSCGKTRCNDYWRITFDGDNKLSVNHPDGFGRRTDTYTLTHDQSDVDTGWLNDPLHAWIDPDGVARVQYPTGFWSTWDYSAYDPSAR